MKNRIVTIKRKTKETDIELVLDLDGTGIPDVTTPVPFLNHMLEAFSKHSGFDLKVKAKGDTHIDDHHTVEDIGICLGLALEKALGDKQGISRYGHFYVPLDEALVRAVVDLSGRNYINFSARPPTTESSTCTWKKSMAATAITSWKRRLRVSPAP
jgi:imidazoleglycerol-phosphate dehydratase